MIKEHKPNKEIKMNSMSHVEQYHLISIQSPNFRGRKKKPGSLIFDPSTQRLGVFLGYCGHCNAKHIADKDTVTYLTSNIKKSNKRFIVRLLLKVAKRLE